MDQWVRSVLISEFAKLEIVAFDILPRLKPWDSFRMERHHIGQKASVIAVVQEDFITRSQQ